MYNLTNLNKVKCFCLKNFSIFLKYGFIFLLFVLVLNVTAQKTTKNNYTGIWTNSNSWSPTWATPQTTGISQNITINGYISHTGNISFGGSGGDLIINDTLVINGDLTLENNNNLTVNNDGILIVNGNVTIANKVDIAANAYIIISGDFTKTGAYNQGTFTSDDEPAKVFIGGTITVPTDGSGNPWASTGPTDVLNCNLTVEHDSSQCNYGNSPDLINDSIYNLVETTCGTITINTQPVNDTVYSGDASFSITSTNATNWQWQVSTGAAFSNISNGGVYTGATTTTLTIPSPPSSMNGYKYRCIAYSSSCFKTSNVATLIVLVSNTITLSSAAGTDAQSLCINTAITNITYTTTGATGATITGLPSGVNGSWAANAVTISGTPNVSGSFTYNVALTGGSGTVSASGTITVNPTPATQPVYRSPNK